MENIGFKYNWGKFYWDAWLNDINLQSCDLAAQGLWINLIALMHKSDQIGYLVINGRPMTIFDIAKRVGIRKDRTERLLKKLMDNDVCSITEDGVLYCRRIVREEKRRYRNNVKINFGVEHKRGDNHINDTETLIYYRPISEIEKDVTTSSSLCRNTKKRIKNIGIDSYIDIVSQDIKGGSEKKYNITGSRLPQGWFPNAECRQYAIDLCLCPEEIIENFYKYWHGKIGKEAIKMDWNAAWRKWCKIASQIQEKKQNSEKKDF